MRPGQLLNQIRTDYIDRLRKAVADHASDGVITVIAEGALRDRAGELIRKGTPPMPLRVDLVTLVNGEVRDALMVDVEMMPSFEPFSVQWEEAMPVTVRPFPWNACPVRLMKVPTGVELSALSQWFEKWFDPEETKAMDEHGLLGVVHGLMNHANDGEIVRYDVDFGSAPLEAFEEMLDALRAMGVGTVEIGQVSKHGQQS